MELSKPIDVSTIETSHMDDDSQNRKICMWFSDAGRLLAYTADTEDTSELGGLYEGVYLKQYQCYIDFKTTERPYGLAYGYLCATPISNGSPNSV